jgi:hypothetical protein
MATQEEWDAVHDSGAFNKPLDYYWTDIYNGIRQRYDIFSAWPEGWPESQAWRGEWENLYSIRGMTTRDVFSAVHESLDFLARQFPSVRTGETFVVLGGLSRSVLIDQFVANEGYDGEPVRRATYSDRWADPAWESKDFDDPADWSLAELTYFLYISLRRMHNVFFNGTARIMSITTLPDGKKFPAFDNSARSYGSDPFNGTKWSGSRYFFDDDGNVAFSGSRNNSATVPEPYRAVWRWGREEVGTGPTGTLFAYGRSRMDGEPLYLGQGSPTIQQTYYDLIDGDQSVPEGTENDKIWIMAEIGAPMIP